MQSKQSLTRSTGLGSCAVCMRHPAHVAEESLQNELQNVNISDDPREEAVTAHFTKHCSVLLRKVPEACCWGTFDQVEKLTAGNSEWHKSWCSVDAQWATGETHWLSLICPSHEAAAAAASLLEIHKGGVLHRKRWLLERTELKCFWCVRNFTAYFCPSGGLLAALRCALQCCCAVFLQHPWTFLYYNKYLAFWWIFSVKSWSRGNRWDKDKMADLIRPVWFTGSCGTDWHKEIGSFIPGYN